MQFDHVRGEKKFILAAYVKQSKAEIAEEMAKCDVVCSNCHHIRTFNRHYPRRNPASFVPIDG